MGPYTQNQWNMPNNTLSFLPQKNTSDYYLENITSGNQTIRNLADDLRASNKEYKEQFNQFLDKYSSVMDEMLAKKNKDTGNIFTNFINGYKNARSNYDGTSLLQSGKNILNNYLLNKRISQDSLSNSNSINYSFPDFSSNDQIDNINGIEQTVPPLFDILGLTNPNVR